MKRDRKTDLWATPDGRRLLADRELLLDAVFAAFARGFTRWFLRPRKRVLITITHVPSGDRLVLSTRSRHAVVEMEAFMHRFPDTDQFDITVLDGRLLFGDPQ
jgi:hypothetical protein